MPPLPFDEIDVLIIERGGKDISGTTLDPNVTGRFWVHGLADLESPRVSAIVLLGITDVSAGNVLGIGFADFIPASLANQIDWEKTYINCFTAGPARRARGRGCRWCCPTRRRASRPRCRCAAAASTSRSESCASTRRCTSPAAGSATRCSPSSLRAPRVVGS